MGWDIYSGQPVILGIEDPEYSVRQCQITGGKYRNVHSSQLLDSY